MEQDISATQGNLRRRIAALQSQLEQVRSVEGKATKRKPEAVVLAPESPQKKKPRLDITPIQGSMPFNATNRLPTKPKPSAHPDLTNKPAPSKLLFNLASVKQQPTEESIEHKSGKRSSGFKHRDAPELPDASSPLPSTDVTNFSSHKRDDNSALVEDLQIGPKEFEAPFDDPYFQNLEPNSGIALSSRSLPHEDLQEYLRGRYYLSPSRLYSCIRLLPDKSGYDVPVDGDWVTIAVVAERGPTRHTKPPVQAKGDNPGKPGQSGKGKGKAKADNEDDESEDTKLGKRFVNLRLIDFGLKDRSQSSATAGKAVIRGDAYLSLLLFEADSCDILKSDDPNVKPQKIYRGGSRGAFESMFDLKIGDVIALLNPRILKPYQRATNNDPHPRDNILALTPESASTIEIIGRARDLGICPAIKRDGKPCHSWCDKRVSDYCDYHVQTAVQHSRAARAEFSVGTGGMSQSAAKRKNARDYDPQRKYGLQPRYASNPSVPNFEQEPGSGATYIFSGHIVTGSQQDPSTIYDSENMGREGQAKAQRKANAKAADKALLQMLERDKDGMKAVIKAREVVKEQKAGKAAGKDTAKADSKQKVKAVDSFSTTPPSSRKAFSVSAIKHIGFDPTATKSGPRHKEGEVEKKLDALRSLQASRKEINLAPRPGPRIRSGVVTPPSRPSEHTIGPRTLHEEARPGVLIDLDDI